MKLPYYRNLDGVRAVAALMVVFYHFFRGVTFDSPLLKFIAKIADFGQTGVTLFFVLSGFLITRILYSTKEANGYFKNFYIRRILRIFPLYYFFLILWYFVLPLITEVDTASFHQEVYYFIYLQGFARTFDWNVLGPHHFWSLAVEEHFYLFWPIVVFRASRKNLVRIIVFIILFAIILRGFMLAQGLSVFIFTFTRFDSLAIGALLALIEIKRSFKQEHSRFYLILLCTSLSLLISMYTIYFGEGNNIVQNLRYLLLSFAYFAIIGYVLSIRKEHIINKLLSLGFLKYTGKISFGLYVYHPMVYLICSKYSPFENIALDFIGKIAVSYLLAGLSYRFIEVPFLKLKKYFDDSKIKNTTVKLE